MKIKKLLFIKLLFLLSILSIGSVNAASFSLSFPGFNGNYIYPNGLASETFDLGVQFSSIQSAELLIEASGTEGLLQICNGALCSTETFGQDFSWNFKFESGHDLVNGTQNVTTTVMPYLFDITAESSFLLDGAGELFIQPNFISSIPPAVITILQPSTYQISNVVLNIEAAVVPVPPALLLFLSGLLGLLTINHKPSKRR